MKGIKFTTSHGGEKVTYTDAANRHEVTICHMENYYFGWYYVEEEENSYQGKMADGNSLETVIATLKQFAREDFGLRYGRAEEVIDLLEKVQAVYPQN